MHISLHSLIHIICGYKDFLESVLFSLSDEGRFSGSAHRRRLFNGVAVAVIGGRRAFKTAPPTFIPAAPVAAGASDLWPGVANKRRRFVTYLPHNALLCHSRVEAGRLDTEAETHLKQRTFSLQTRRKHLFPTHRPTDLSPPPFVVLLWRFRLVSAVQETQASNELFLIRAAIIGALDSDRLTGNPNFRGPFQCLPFQI